MQYIFQIQAVKAKSLKQFELVFSLRTLTGFGLFLQYWKANYVLRDTIILFNKSLLRTLTAKIYCRYSYPIASYKSINVVILFKYNLQGIHKLSS